MTILDPATNFVVTLDLNDGSGNTTSVNRSYGQAFGSVTAPTRTNHNFLGWFDGASDNANPINSSQVITGDVTFYAHWQRIVCKKVTNANNLHTETCEAPSGSGCRLAGFANNSPITYGTISAQTAPVAGDAYDCDVNGDGSYDTQTQYGKYSERFYFLRTIDNGDSDDTAALVYYTGYDTNGLVDSQHDSPINSASYDTVLGWLPTSSSWANSDLITFDSKVARFLKFADIEAVCGSPLTTTNTAYFTACNKWFFFENSRFQSESYGRSGIWISHDSNKYYRIHTSSVNVASPDTGASSANTARPVIEIPMTALEGYVNVERFTISFNTHGGDAMPSVYRYNGETLGNIEDPVRQHYEFDGWYANYDSTNETYSNAVSSSTVVTGDMTLHAKWLPLTTTTVTFNANGGAINGENTFDLTVDLGEAIPDEDYPVATHATLLFGGWYTDSETTQLFDASTVINNPITLYAGWTDKHYVARVGNNRYETLAEAIAAVPGGSSPVKTTVKIIDNITLTASVTIPNTKWVELDGEGYTIDGAVSLFTNNGKLDIVSGNYVTAHSSSVVSIVLNKTGSSILNISGGNLTNNSTHTGDNSIIEQTGGTVNVSGGVLTCHAQAAAINNKSSGTTNVTGGRIIGTNNQKGQAIYVEKGGKVNISGDAYLESVSTSSGDKARATVDNAGGTIVITGGTIVSKAYHAVEQRKSDNSASTTIGISDNTIDKTTPMLLGKEYGIKKTAGTVNVYDGLFGSETHTTAVNGTIDAHPTPFYDDETPVTIDSRTYHVTYLQDYEYAVKFYTEINTLLTEVTIQNGSTIGASNMPTDPTKTGYYFDGWYDGDDEIISSTVVDKDINAYARWVQSVANATMPTELTVEVGSTVKIEFEEDDIEKVTYSSSNTSYATVNTQGVVTGVAVGDTIITLTGIKSNTPRTITIHVIPATYTVTFLDSDGETELATRTVVDGGSLGNNMYNPNNNNYVIEKWNIKDTIVVFTNETTVTGDMEVVANWNETISYATLSTTPNPFEISINGTGQITLNPTVQGDIVEAYTLTSEDDTIASIDSNNVITGLKIDTVDIIITGNVSGFIRRVSLTVSVVKKTVTFKDGSTVLTTVNVPVGSSIANTPNVNMPSNPSKTGYVFGGWYIEGSSLAFTSETSVSNDINVIALWKEKITHAQSIEDPITLHLGSSKQIIIEPTGDEEVEDYTLSSSNTNTVEVNGKEIFGTSLGSVTLTITGSETITVTVNVVNTYNVTFDPDNGDNSTVVAIAENTAIGDIKPSTNPTKSGYVFDRWYLYDEVNEELTITPFNPNTVITGDITYKAMWVQNTYYVAADLPGGTTYHTSIKEAIDSLTTTDETDLRILQNINSTSGQTIVPANRNIVLIGGDFTVDCGSGATNQLMYISSDASARVKSGTFICGKSTLAVFETQANGTLYVDGGLIYNTNNRGAVYNSGAVVISGGILKSDATIRPVVQNANNGASITMTGGEVIQTSTANVGTSGRDDGRGAIKVIGNTTATIKGGTVTANAGNSPAIYATGGTLVIGTDEEDNSYDATNPVIQNANYYGIESSINYSIFDGIIKGKTAAVNNESRITGTETGTEKVTETLDGYAVLYYEIPQTKYRIYFHAGDGTASDEYIDYDLNEEITAGDLATATYTGYSFDGWYSDNNTFQTPFVAFTPTTVGTTHYYAKWNLAKYRIYFEAGDGTASDEYIDYNLNEEITANDLATATRGIYTFDGWYLDNNTFQTPFVAFTPTTAGEVYYYAKWSYASSLTPVNHIVTSDAMTYYFNNVNTWATADGQIAANQDTNLSNDDHTTYLSNMYSNFNNYSCSECEWPNNVQANQNKCDSPGVGTYCDKPQGYDTGVNDELNVYLFVNGAKSGSKLNDSTAGNYITVTNGVIYNMIPGNDYYWELSSDSNVYGVVSVTKNGTHYRRTLNTSVRNLRDLGGMPVSYTVNGITTTGTIKYGRLYRGAQIASGQTGVDDLKKLGITREVDLRQTGDGNNGQSKFESTNYDVSLSDTAYFNCRHVSNQNAYCFANPNSYSTNGYYDVKITNYQVNPDPTTYFSNAYSDNFDDLKAAMKAIMRQIVNHENVFFHCTIGTDRTGTIAYFLEGLLGVSEEDRLRDYEMTYFFGLTNRSRFHNNLSTSGINPRFYAMYKSYPTVADIEAFYKSRPESDDDSLLQAFRSEMIN